VDAVSPRELVTFPKQRHISKVAQRYLTIHSLHDTNANFAVLTIDFSENPPKIEWIPDAFPSAYGY
jgi:Holliday junction resolvase-like predicted endonuclease